MPRPSCSDGPPGSNTWPSTSRRPDSPSPRPGRSGRGWCTSRPWPCMPARRPIPRHPSGGMRTSPSNRSRRPTSTPAASVWPRTWCGTRRPSATDSPGVCGSRDRPLHRSPAGAGGGVLRLGREPLHRRSDPRRARLAAADPGPRGDRAHRRLVSRKRKARALVPGIVSVLSGSWLRPALFLGGGLGGRFGGRGHLLRRIGHHLVGRVGHHHMRRIGHHHLGRVGRRLRRLLLGLLTRAHRHQGEDHCETLHAGSSREKSSGAGFGRGKPSGGPPGVKTAARCRVYQADMTDRRSFVAWLGTLPLGGRDRPLRSAPIVIEATPTALYQQPDGRNNLVRVAVTGLDAPAARARVTDRRGTLVGTAGLLPTGVSLAGELWVPLSRALGTEFQIDVEVGKQRVGRRLVRLVPPRRWTLYWIA